MTFGWGRGLEGRPGGGALMAWDRRESLRGMLGNEDLVPWGGG